MKKSIISIVLSLLLVLTNYSYSQLDVDFSSQSGYTSNQFDESSFNSPISMNTLSLTYSSANNFSFYGGAGLAQYFSFSERNYLTSFLGTGYSAYTNSAENSSINIYGTMIFRQSVNTEDYSDSKQFYGGISYVSALDEGFILDIASDLKYKSFDFINELNFFENTSGFVLNKSFETKTAIKLTGNLHSKFYYAIPDNPDDLIYNRQGRLITDMSSSAFQFRYALQAAQNIFEQTGITAVLEGSAAINEYVTPLDYVGYDFAGDSEFFDDPYSFQFTKYQLKLTQILPAQIKAVLSYSMSSKNYNYEIQINESEEYSVRFDKLSSLGISLQKRINFDSSFINGLNLRLDYEYFDNSSNFIPMNYHGSFILLGIDLGI